MATRMPKKIHISVPTIDVSTVNEIMRGIYSKHPTPVRYLELATMLNIKPTHVSAACVTAYELDLLERTARGIYRLSNDGLKYGQYLELGKKEKYKKILQGKILSSTFWEEVVAFLKANVGRRRKIEDLALHVAQMLGKSWKAVTQTTYGRYYAGTLEIAGLVEYDRSAGEITPIMIGEGITELEEEVVPEAITVAEIQRMPVSLQLSINVDIGDEESFARLLKLLRTLGYKLEETD